MQGKPITGIVSLNARREGARVVIVVSDDGRGIDWKAVQDAAICVAFRPTRTISPDCYLPQTSPPWTTAHDFSGDGSGLAAVAEIIERVNGIIQLETVPGLGTSVTIILPISLVLQNVVVLADGPHFWGIPEAAVQASIVPSIADVVETTEVGDGPGSKPKTCPWFPWPRRWAANPPGPKTTS